MSKDLKNLKLISVSNTPQIAAAGFAQLLYHNNISFINHFSPDYNDKIIVFKFPTIENKENALNIENLNNKLIALKFDPISSTPQNHREVFIHSISPLHFKPSNNENLDQKLALFKTNFLKACDLNTIHRIHFMQDYVDNIKQAPRSMIVTFKTLDHCKKFINSDTFLPQGTILSKHKRFNKTIKHKYCTICRRTGHRKGDPACDEIPHCPRCWSSDHTSPQSCIESCWSCGPGHASNSNRCPLNRDYVKSIRNFNKLNNLIANQTSTTPEPQKQLHSDILNLKNALTNKSYSSAVKNATQIPAPPPISQMPAPPPISQMPTPSPINPQIISSNPTSNSININNVVFNMAFNAACRSESTIPNSFQKVMDNYFKLNKIPLIIHPTPDPRVIQAVATQTTIQLPDTSVPVPQLPETLSQTTSVSNLKPSYDPWDGSSSWSIPESVAESTLQSFISPLSSPTQQPLKDSTHSNSTTRASSPTPQPPEVPLSSSLTPSPVLTTITVQKPDTSVSTQQPLEATTQPATDHSWDDAVDDWLNNEWDVSRLPKANSFNIPPIHTNSIKEPSAPWYHPHPCPTSTSGKLYTAIAWTHDFPPSVITLCKIKDLELSQNLVPENYIASCAYIHHLVKERKIALIPNSDNLLSPINLDVHTLERISKDRELENLDMEISIIPHKSK